MKKRINTGIEEIEGIEQLVTIQKREKLNEVLVFDKKDESGANHLYAIQRHDMVDKKTNMMKATSMARIEFQKGPRGEEGEIPGVADQDLLEIVKHRLEGFQRGPYSSRENENAVRHIEEALMWLNRRIEDRIERKILGKNIK